MPAYLCQVIKVNEKNINRIAVAHYLISLTLIVVYVLLYMIIDKIVVMLFLQIVVVIIIPKFIDSYSKSEIFVRGFYVRKQDKKILYFYYLFMLISTFVFVVILIFMILSGYIAEELYYIDLRTI